MCNSIYGIPTVIFSPPRSLPAGIQANDQYGEQFVVMFTLVMNQLKQVSEISFGKWFPSLEPALRGSDTHLNKHTSLTVYASEVHVV